MNSPSPRRRGWSLAGKLLAFVGALFFVFVSGNFAPAPAHAAFVPIQGSGSTWSQNALDQWKSNVSRNYGIGINYNGTGSTQGRKDFMQGMVDFAVSEIPFQARPEDGSPAEVAHDYAYMPIVAGGTSLMYNLKIGGQRVTNLRLSGDVVTKIFKGQITNWNDPAIQADNPALAMPNKTITPIIRSDGSGTTAQFTLWMSKQYGDIWGGPMTSQFPPFPGSKAQKGSDGVAGYISQNYGEGAIGYVEYSYARNAKFPVAKLLNKAGYYSEPTATSVAVALTAAQINRNPGPDYLTQVLDGVYNNGDPRAYPMSSYSYAIIPTAPQGTFSEKKGDSLNTFMRYVLCEGQQTADALGYSPLPINLVLAGSDQVKRIPGGGGRGVEIGTCNNPTVDPSDPNGNALAKNAQNPPDCDKKGDTQCTTGTAGATGTTKVTGKGKGVDPKTGSVSTGGGGAGGSSGGSSSKSTAKSSGKSTSGSNGGSGSGSGGAGSTDGGSGTDSSAADGSGADSGNPDEGGAAGGSGSSGGGAVGTAYEMQSDGFGSSQWLMVASAGLLTAIVSVPPILMNKFNWRLFG